MNRDVSPKIEIETELKNWVVELAPESPKLILLTMSFWVALQLLRGSFCQDLELWRNYGWKCFMVLLYICSYLCDLDRIKRMRLLVYFLYFLSFEIQWCFWLHLGIG